MPKTLLLDRTAWDLVLDSGGNVALAGEPYSIAQDVASAIRTFLGECWYDVTQGIPFWQEILGFMPPDSLVKARIINAAKTVPNVADVSVIFLDFTDRVLTGQVQIIDVNGKKTGVSF